MTKDLALWMFDTAKELTDAEAAINLAVTFKRDASYGLADDLSGSIERLRDRLKVELSFVCVDARSIASRARAIEKAVRESMAHQKAEAAAAVAAPAQEVTDGK